MHLDVAHLAGYLAKLETRITELESKLAKFEDVVYDLEAGLDSKFSDFRRDISSQDQSIHNVENDIYDLRGQLGR